MHLTAIDPQDAHFKGLVWPPFVTGAEAQTTDQRTAIKAVFGHLCEVWQCQNVNSAVEVLESLWAREFSAGGRRSWIEYLYEKG